ncbi:hypothetical protein [Clavibacter michiganensis]|uniref:hypothetical protein n=1 Tax=Clavibacter michiganensis TaxID=28447 RepID=UPI001F4F085B|nr:hypothetical protein [Clavibacter michiganensis]MDO4033371.1 hypothetical protein [Clavibacter michiganensis]MDO4089104.1 hypothetical protein [Clavibacter michiganensis]MDO4098082.1 hypothetical protein [Clavibacter michiganensis]
MPVTLPDQPTPRSSDAAAVAGIDELVTAALLGGGRRPSDFPPAVQDFHGRVLRPTRMLTGRGYELAAADADAADDADADAARGAGDVVLTIAAGTGRITFAPPAELPADAIWQTGTNGAEHADDVTVHEYIGQVETAARKLRRMP